MPPNQFESHKKMMNFLNRRKSSIGSDLESKSVVSSHKEEVRRKISRGRISNYYLKGSKDILTAKSFTQVRFEFHGVEKICWPHSESKSRVENRLWR